jgi:hypothetical protein
MRQDRKGDKGTGAAHADELAGDFGNRPEGISTSNHRVFRLSAGN